MLHYYRELSWKQHQNLQKENLYAMLCIGAIEQHGPHLAVGTDDMIIEYILRRLIGDEEIVPEVYVLPPLHFGLSPEHMNLCGTISSSPMSRRKIYSMIISSVPTAR